MCGHVTGVSDIFVFMYGVQSENDLPIPALGFGATRSQGRSPLIRIVLELRAVQIL